VDGCGAGAAVGMAARAEALKEKAVNQGEVMHLNGWQRIGIGLSIVWAVGAAVYQRNADLDRSKSFVDYAFRVCTDAKELAHDTDLKSCLQEREKHTEIWLEGSWGNVAILSLVPIPLAWIAVYILLGFWRGAVIGFHAVVPWRTLTRWRKFKVVSSLLITFVVVGFGILLAMNLYVETLVPVGLPPGVMVIQSGEDVAMLKGTWTREGASQDSRMAYPLQTSRITCYRKEGRCMEALASVSGTLLDAELVEYAIESWSDTTIVFVDDAMCASTVYTVDRKTESVNGVGHSIMDSDYCKRFVKKPEKSWNLHLTDGFKVYWGERQKARPIALRLIQTLFGN